MPQSIKIIFGLLGGLAIFIYGMNLMSETLQKVAGEKMKKILALLTKNPFFGVIAGALTTAVLQSSSATTVMAIGFVSAGLMNLLDSWNRLQSHHQHWNSTWFEICFWIAALFEKQPLLFYKKRIPKNPANIKLNRKKGTDLDFTKLFLSFLVKC